MRTEERIKLLEDNIDKLKLAIKKIETTQIDRLKAEIKKIEMRIRRLKLERAGDRA